MGNDGPLSYFEALDFLSLSAGENGNVDAAEKHLQNAREIIAKNVRTATDDKSLASYFSYLESTGADIAVMKKDYARALQLY